jgi:predicted phage terminase large subunit-like protein
MNIYRESFRAFIEKAFRIIHGKPLEDSPYLDVVIDHLEDFLRGDTKKLLINLPGRHLKSFACSICFPAYALALDPTLKFLIGAYNEDLSEDIVRQTREIMESRWYKSNFKTRISKAHSRSNDFSIEGGGRVRAVPIRSLTGKGGDITILDDPHNVDDWDNDRKKSKVVECFETLVSRRDAGKQSRMLVVGHRIAEDDLSAHILERGDFEHLCLPLFAPEKLRFDIAGGSWELAKGEALRPDAFPPDEITALQRNHCGSPFWLYYQQGLGPRSDQLDIDVSDFPFLPDGPSPRQMPKGFPIILSVDCAQKTSSTSRNVVHVYLVRGDEYALMQAWAAKCSFNHLVNKVMQLAAENDAWSIIVEATARGPSLIEELEDELSIPIIPVTPQGKKMKRLRRCAPIIRAKRIRIWRSEAVEEAIDEIVAYPNSPYDDHVDAMTNFLIEVPNIVPNLNAPDPATTNAPCAVALASQPQPLRPSVHAVIVRRRSVFDAPALPDFSDGQGDDAPIYVMVEDKKVRIR